MFCVMVEAVASDRGNARVVYSTDAGRICPGCGWPARDCRCSKAADQAQPTRIVAKLRVEKTGRGGKTVTVVYDLPRNAPFLKDLCQELKRACGTGGAVADCAGRRRPLLQREKTPRRRLHPAERAVNPRPCLQRVVLTAAVRSRQARALDPMQCCQERPISCGVFEIQRP